MTSRPWSLLACALAALSCSACTGWQSAMDPQGLPAFNLHALMSTIMIGCAIVWLLVVIVLALALWRPRSTRSPSRPVPEKRMAVIVSSALVATVMIITAFTVASFFTTRALSNADPDALLIKVRGYQWWWAVDYLDARTGETFTTANEIYVPVGRTVRLQLSAADVIHSFWVPSLAGKQDLVPGRDNELAFVAQRTGVYRGQCAEFCGIQHARMAALVIAVPADQFDAWKAKQRADASAPVTDEVRAGRDVFTSKACGSCHTVRGTPAVGRTGPDLTHVAGRRYIAAGALETTRGSLAAWIADPQKIKPGNNMPMISLSAEELNAVSAYMASLQ